MLIECAKSSPAQVYYIMTQIIIPRPIAWILSDNGNGTHNLAPFSFFNGVSSEPPIIMISAGYKDDGSRKDTWANIADRSHFVVHIPSGALTRQVADSAAGLPHGMSEVKMTGLSVVAVEGWPLPRLEGPRAAFYCERYEIHMIGDQAMILGEIKGIWLDDAVATKEKRAVTVDAKALDPLARLGFSDFARLGEIQTVKTPKHE